MRARSRHARRAPCHRQDYCWPVIGLAAGLMLLAGCGLSAPAGGSGTGSPTPGQVTLISNQQHYAPGETVVITIANGLSTRILAADHRSDCTVVTIELQSGQSWQPQNPCRLMSPTRLVPLEAGHALTQQVRPPQAAGAAGWTPGTYRIAFTYRLNASDEGPTIYSATFVVA